MKLWLSKNSDVPVREQLITQIRLGIATEDLKPGDKLPSVRELARRFGIHANTVSAAYNLLAESGLIELRKGSGTYVRAGRDGSAPGLDDMIDRFFEAAAAEGYSVEEINANLRNRLDHSFRREILVLESDAGLREILLSEIRTFVGIECIGATITDLPLLRLKGVTIAAMFDEKDKVESAVPAGTACVFLKANSVSRSLAGRDRPHEAELLAVVSGWKDFLKFSTLILTAAGIESERVIPRDVSEPGWQRGLDAASVVICDTSAAGYFQGDPRLAVFRLISEASLAELRGDATHQEYVT